MNRATRDWVPDDAPGADRRDYERVFGARQRGNVGYAQQQVEPTCLRDRAFRDAYDAHHTAERATNLATRIAGPHPSQAYPNENDPTIDAALAHIAVSLERIVSALTAIEKAVG